MKPPDTPQTLLNALSEDEASHLLWKRFVSLYTPLIRAWLELRGLPEDSLDDATQEVLLALVRHLRAKDYQRERARFRTYLSVIIHSIASDRLRQQRRHAARTSTLPVDVEEIIDPTQVDLSVQLDAQYRLARYTAALQALQHQADLSPLQRAVLEGCFLRGESPTDLAVRLKLRPNSVIQARRRLRQRIDQLVERWEL